MDCFDLCYTIFKPLLLTLQNIDTTNMSVIFSETFIRSKLLNIPFWQTTEKTELGAIPTLNTTLKCPPDY